MAVERVTPDWGCPLDGHGIMQLLSVLGWYQVSPALKDCGTGFEPHAVLTMAPSPASPPDVGGEPPEQAHTRRRGANGNGEKRMTSGGSIPLI
jgi:hypothetical protein